MQLVLDTNGLAVKKRNKAFWIIGKQQQRIISPHRITSIAVRADCLISSAAIRLAAKHQIPVFFFNAAGRAEARLWSTSFVNLASIRRQQVLFELLPAATQWVTGLFRLKARHQLNCLRYVRNRRPGLSKQVQATMGAINLKLHALKAFEQQPIGQCRHQLMGIEGNMAKTYWKQLSAAMPAGLQFEGRSRRPAQDPFNAALNYLYGMLYNLTSSAILAAGLDLNLGFLHIDQYNKPTLTFDMIEPFRPWVDRLLVEQCLTKKWAAEYTLQKEDGWYLSPSGRRYAISLFNDWVEQSMLFNHRRLSRKNHLYRFAGEFAQYLQHEFVFDRKDLR